MKRKKLYLKYNFDKNWIGGTYYVTNLISSFNHLPEELRPEVIVVSSGDNKSEVLASIGYPYLTYLNLSPPYSLNYLEKKIYAIQPSIVKYFKRKFFKLDNLDYSGSVFPYDFSKQLRKVKNKIFWIPDFQEYYLPYYFSKDEIVERKKLHKRIANKKDAILVLSSVSAGNDFAKFYPKAKCNVKIIPFAVTHPSISHLNFSEVCDKHGITGDYFIVSNQFWSHKNHLTVLKALEHLKCEYSDVKILFTGKEHDYRNPNYAASLKEYVNERNLGDNVFFLGLIDRCEQLLLIRRSIALIQPSLFEGWSTVIEDAKALGKLVLVSNLQVHKEQLQTNGHFFDPLDFMALANLMMMARQQNKSISEINYEKSIMEYATKFINIL